MAHPLARLRGMGEGKLQAEAAGAVTDIFWCAKANTGSRGGVRVGQADG